MKYRIEKGEFFTLQYLQLEVIQRHTLIYCLDEKLINTFVLVKYHILEECNNLKVYLEELELPSTNICYCLIYTLGFRFRLTITELHRY